jgi:hypothetical protein
MISPSTTTATCLEAAASGEVIRLYLFSAKAIAVTADTNPAHRLRGYQLSIIRRIVGCLLDIDRPRAKDCGIELQNPLVMPRVSIPIPRTTRPKSYTL